MVFLSLLLSFLCFLFAALTPVFNWSLGEFDATAWGLTFLSLAFLLPGAVTMYKTRSGP